MKYALIDGEIHIHQREADAWWPLSIEEAQHVVDVMNARELGNEVLAAAMKAHAKTPQYLVDATSTMLASLPTGMIERAEALLDNTHEPE